MGAVFSMQGFGQLGGAVVMLCLVAGFKNKLETATSYATCTGDCQVAVDKMWRALIGIGVVRTSHESLGGYGTDAALGSCLHRPLLPSHYSRDPAIHVSLILISVKTLHVSMY